MDLFHHEPAFSSARGVVQQWMDWERARDANHRFRLHRHDHAVRAEAEARARDPEYDAKRARARRASAFEHVKHHSLAGLPKPMTIPTEQEWSRMREVMSVEVRVPDISRISAKRAAGADSAGDGGRVVNTHASISRYEDCYGPHPREALALLNPRCFFHGWDVLEEGDRDAGASSRARPTPPNHPTVRSAHHGR